MPSSYSQYKLSNKALPLALTDDDHQIMLEAYRHDVVDAHTIRLLLPHRSQDVIGRRLNRLRKNHYLIRLRQREEIRRPGGGTYSKAYALGDKGYQNIKMAFKLPPKKLRYNESARRLTATTIKHALEQSQFLVSVRKSVEATPPLEFLYPEQIYERYAPKILQQKTLPRMLRTKVNWHGYKEFEGTLPDGFFMIVDPSKPVGKQRRTIFLEIDRGTMTVDPSDTKIRSLTFWKDSSMLRKFLVYEFASKTRAHQKTFGVETYQVLTVTTNPQHRATMQAMFQNRLAKRPITANPFRFLFTDFETIHNYGYDILSTPVENAVGTRVELSP